MTYAEYIKAMRKEAGMTQKEFAKYFDIPVRTLEEWEAGNRKMPAYLLRLLTYRLEVEKKIQERGEQIDDVIEENR